MERTIVSVLTKGNNKAVERAAVEEGRATAKGAASDTRGKPDGVGDEEDGRDLTTSASLEPP